MVRQLPSTDISNMMLKSDCSYYAWLCKQSGIEGPLARLFYETDFRWDEDIEDDKIRAENAKDLREQYAIFMLAWENAADVISKEQWHDIDRLKKSIIGDACVFEVLVYLARELDSMLNMESESQVPKYFERLMMNVGFDFYDEEDWDGHPDEVDKYWKKLLDRVLDRTYLPDGEGGLFPLDVAEKKCEDQRKRPLWNQMNDWIDQQIDIEDEW